MFSLFIRNLFFTILQPGIVAGLLPFLILGKPMNKIINQHLQFVHFAAIFIFLTGFAIMLDCIIRFAIQGRGTLSPADPTKKLVMTGLYKFSRNPMYLGVTLLLIGEAIFFQSVELLIYAFFILILFSIFIVAVEEPRMRKDFGEEYVRYCKKVKRWI